MLSITNNQRKIILKHLKESLDVNPTEEQYKEIACKKELIEYIKVGKLIEWEFTVTLSGSSFSCCPDGAVSWVMDNLGELYTVNFEKVIWNPQWQLLD